MHYSPFRYPGGKSWFIKHFNDWVVSLDYHPKTLIDPFCGGGAISINSVIENFVDQVIMIEIDKDVSSVWETIISGNSAWLIKKIETFDCSVYSIDKLLSDTSSDIELTAFQTIVKNRVNFGGILADGAGRINCGDGRGIASRWCPVSIINRINKIVAVKERITFINDDAFKYLDRDYGEDAVFFIDPPYTMSRKKPGKRLYNNFCINHELLFSMVKELRYDFLMTYDDSEEIISLINQNCFKFKKIPMKTTHHKDENELMIFN